MEQEFRTAYKKLNDAQRQAVDAIDGPVLVVAGPGTGKTQLLAVRVANILLKTDTDAGNILCLTFTSKAAVNMRERLFKLIGPAARNVAVRTFHSFAADVMNQYPDYFWEGARLSVAPDAVQLEIIQGILANLPLDNPLASTFAGSYTALGDVKGGLKLAKEAGLTPDQLRGIITANLKYIDDIEPHMVELLSPVLNAKRLPTLQSAINELPKQNTSSDLLLPMETAIQESLAYAVTQDEPTGKTKHVGNWKKRWIQSVNGQKGMFSERKRNIWWLAVADVYETYRDRLHEHGYYDYSDMLLEVIEQLQGNPDMLADLQERFLYLLIDEFQDTNAAQLRLAHLVADHYSANNRPNLMAVGDDDQSIFAFNGAELNNMLGFRRSYPDTKLIVLKDNYRSTQDILDTSKQIIELAQDRLVNREPDIDKRLTAQTIPTGKAEINHLAYPTRAHQHSALAARIKQMWDEGERDIAVLARKHTSLQQVAAILLANGLPVRYEQQSNVLEHDAVQQVCLIADLAIHIAEGDRAEVNTELAALLRHPMWELSPRTLWRLAAVNYSHPDWLDQLLNSEDEKLNSIGNWLVELSRLSHQQALPLTMEYILGLREGQYMTSPFRDYYLSLRPTTSTYLETLSAVQLLCDMSYEFAGDPATLADFVRFVELNLSTKRVIADESWFTTGDQAIQLLTIYKAKGLEFDNVFLVDAIETMWRPRSGGRTSPANLQLQAYGEKYDDYVRLLYVAATRARRSFTATSYTSDDRGNPILATPLLSAVPMETIEQPAEDAVTVLENELRWPRLESSNEKALLADRLENYSLSPTALIDFLNVAEAGPGSFLERHLLRLPRSRSAVGSYGTAIHAALETAQRLVNTGKIDLGTITDRFEAALRDEHLAPVDYDRYHTRGLELLPKLLQAGNVEFYKGGLAEQRIDGIHLESARIKGKLDRIDLIDKDLIISDYKTGKALGSFDTHDQTKMVKAWRHKTQLLFYCLLASRDSRFKMTHSITAQMLYVEAESPKQFSLGLQPDPTELERLANLAEAVWHRIQNLDFPDTASYTADREGIAKFEDDLLKGTK